MTHDVFISYSHKDKVTADAVCNYLERDGIRCWIAPRDISIGDTWAEAIVDAISKSKVFLLLFSSNSNNSKQVLREVEIATNNELIIMPFKIEDTTPTGGISYYLASIHWIDALDDTMESKVLKIKNKINIVLNMQKNDNKIDNKSKKHKICISKKNKIKYLKYIFITSAFILIVFLFVIRVYYSKTKENIITSNNKVTETVSDTLSQPHSHAIYNNTISTGDTHTVGIQSDGTLVVAGKEDVKSVKEWTDIIAVSAHAYDVIGLKSDGTVLAVLGDNPYGNFYTEAELENWSDIVEISNGWFHVVGLKADGTVVSTGSNAYGECSVDNWSDIASISAGACFTLGIKRDGTVLITGGNEDGGFDIDNWSSIISVSVSNTHIVGLRNDGSVTADGDNSYGQCDVDNWSDIISVSAGEFHTVGLKADGTVVIAGDCLYGESDTETWDEIVAIDAGYFNTIGQKSDGTVLAVGLNDNGQCNVSDWVDIKTPEWE